MKGMVQTPLFVKAFPYRQSTLTLPVTDLDAASQWYARAFGMTEVERIETPHPTVVLERDGVRLGFAINGGDAGQDGAAILVADIESARNELRANGVQTGNPRIDERNGKRFQVFFVVAPDGLCYYFHQPIE